MTIAFKDLRPYQQEAVVEILKFLAGRRNQEVKVTVDGPPGSGKSTVMSWLAGNIPRTGPFVDLIEGDDAKDRFVVRLEPENDYLNDRHWTYPATNPTMQTMGDKPNRPLPACGSTCDCPEDGPCEAEDRADRRQQRLCEIDAEFPGDSLWHIRAAEREATKEEFEKMQEGPLDEPRWPQVGDVAFSPLGECGPVTAIEGDRVVLGDGVDAYARPKIKDVLATGWRFEPAPEEKP